MKELSLLTWNLGNPSVDRAERQLEWLAKRPEDVLVLTETKASAGCQMLADAFRAASYDVVCPTMGPGELSTMIVSRVTLGSDDWASRLPYLPSRACSAMVPTSTGPVHLIGLYVPSRDGSPEKTARKRDFLASCRDGLDMMPSTHGRTILMGDLNILEPDHQPHYPFFAPFEYGFYRCLLEEFEMVDAFRRLNPTRVEHSWVGRTGDGYRYDHIFCSRSLTDALRTCDYITEPRLSRLSDHSALTVSLNLDPVADRRISDASSSLQPLSLF
ncbi:MAG: exodeoxyribonuclease [Actinomycetota bacterium]|nr:exodeoxyribonuclease [Actinomycetota bacterium]